jgi:hypothetical protein
MVHALKEFWRVLVPRGVLIDLRPICMDVDLLILSTHGWKSAGRVDRGELRLHDNAANLATRRVVNGGLFHRIKTTYFTTKYFWNELEGLKTDTEGCWKEDASISEDTWRRAGRLLEGGNGEDRICISVKEKIVIYQKVSS